MMRPLVVVYDQGAAQPGDIAVGLAQWTPCVFAVPPNDHTNSMRPLLEQFGAVVAVDSIDDAVARLGERHPGGITTFSEKALRLTGELADRLDLPYHDKHVVSLLTDKTRQREVLRKSGVDGVLFHRIESDSDWQAAVAETGLPAVLKPVYGGASRNTYLIEDFDTGLNIARELLFEGKPGYEQGGALVLEEYLVGRDCAPFGDYVSIESVVEGGRVDTIAVTGKLPMVSPFRETGRFWPSTLDPFEDKAVRVITQDAITALGITSGVVHTEIKLTHDGPRLIEVNGRLGGGINELASRALGTNLLEVAGRVALGQHVRLPELSDGTVFFQLFHPAPRRPCVLVGVEGADLVRALPGVEVYRPYVRPGTTLSGGVHTQELDVVIGRVGSHHELARLVAEIDSRLTFHFSFADRPAPCSVNGDRIGEL